MPKTLLSICIATYNRADFIGATLESIIPQLTSDIEVVIVDGASTDSTKSVVEDYAKDCYQIRYIRLPKKGGVDQDYCKAVEYASGEMCWLFTDDDLLLPNAISTVLNEIKKGYILIIVNSQLMTIDFTNQIAGRLLKIYGNEIFSEKELEILFQRVITYLSFIGAVVINRELWLKREKKRYFGTEFIHVGVIFQSPLPAKTLVISEPYIQIRYGNAQWSKRAFQIGMIKWPTLLNSFDDITEEVKKRFTCTTPFSQWRSMLIYRSKGQYTFSDYVKWSDLKNESILIKSVSMLISVVPSIVLNTIFLLYLKTIERDNLIAIYDLKKFNIDFFAKMRRFLGES